MGLIKKNYHCVKQQDMSDCGAACLATISKQYDLNLSLTKIRKMAGTDRKGTSAFGLVKAARDLKFEVKAVRATIEDINEKLPLPCIAYVLIDEKIYHYIVIHEINKNKMIIADPMEGIVTYSKEEFNKIWQGVLILLTPGDEFEKRDEKTNLLVRFTKLMIPFKSLLIHIFFASILYTSLGLFGAFYFKFLIDDILGDRLLSSLTIFSVGMIFLNLFKIILNGFREHILLHLGQKVNVSLISKYYNHVMGLPMSFFDTRRVGEILSRMSDANKIMNAISGATLTVMVDTIMLLLATIILAAQNLTLFLVSLLFIPLHIILAWLFTKPFQKIHRLEMEKGANLESYLVESLNGVAAIKSLNGEEICNNETESRFIKFVKMSFKAGWMRNLSNSIEWTINSLSNIIILWIGGIQVIKGNISIGQLIAYNALFSFFFEPIKRLINLIPSLQEAVVASDRLGEILDLDQEKSNEQDKIVIEKLQGDIIFKDLVFRYGTRKTVLNKINLEIKSGEKIAVVGESGSGKTTLVKLLLKYYTPESGNLLIDGHNVNDINTESLRENIGYVPQDIFLFSGSIKENIAFGVEISNQDEVIEAAKKAQAHEFINEMQRRYDTTLGERGATLSGGQRQRIAFARTILKKPNMLILDEATSSLDTKTEKALHETIDSLSKGITTIIIAHRLSTIRSCDRIVVMDKGNISEVGTHKELLEKKGKYYNLWSNQTEGSFNENVNS